MGDHAIRNLTRHSLAALITSTALCVPILAHAQTYPPPSLPLTGSEIAPCIQGPGYKACTTLDTAQVLLAATNTWTGPNTYNTTGPNRAITINNAGSAAGLECLDTSTSASATCLETRTAGGSPPSFTPPFVLPGDGVPATALSIHCYSDGSPCQQDDEVRTQTILVLKNAFNLVTAPLPTASFTGSVSTTTLTATSVTGYITAQQPLDDITGNLTAGTTVVGQLTGTPGGAGTYTVSISQTVGSPEAMTAVGSAQQGTGQFLSLVGFGPGVLGVSAFKVITGGTNCTPGAQTFTLNGGTHPVSFLPATATITVSAAGTISGDAPTSVQGNYNTLPANDGTATLAGGSCSVPPTVKYWQAEAGGAEDLLDITPSLNFLAHDPAVIPTWDQPMIINTNTGATNPSLQINNAAIAQYGSFIVSPNQGLDVETTGTGCSPCTAGHTLNIDNEYTGALVMFHGVNKGNTYYLEFSNGTSDVDLITNTGALNATAGSVSAPTFADIGGTTTGIYFPTSTSISLDVNGADTFVCNTVLCNSKVTLQIPTATWADNQTCTAGQISVDANFFYVCTASNTVKRAALSAF